MNKEKIIKTLSNDLKEFKPVATASKTALNWVVMSFILTALVTFLIDDFREGALNQLLEYPRFSLEILLGIGIVTTLAIKVIGLSIPGTKTKVTDRILVFLTISFAGLFSYSFIEPSMPPSMAGKRPYCFYEGLIYGSILLTSILYLAKNRAPFEATAIGTLGGVASCSITSVIMHTACMHTPDHILGHHLSPILLIAIVGAISGKIFLKKTNSL